MNAVSNMESVWNKIRDYSRKVLDAISSGINFIFSLGEQGKEEVQKIKKRVRVGFVPISPRDVPEIPEKYMKEVGFLKAELARRDEIIKRLLKKIELLEGKRREELIKLIEERRKALVKVNRKYYLKVGTDLPGNIKVLSKDHKFLGWFSHFLIGDGMWRIVVSEYPDRKGRKYEVWRGQTLDYLFHHAENLEDQIRAGVLILNRTWDGYYVPDIDAKFPKIFPPNWKVKCELCRKEFDNVDALIEHYKKSHKVDLVGGEESVGRQSVKG